MEETYEIDPNGDTHLILHNANAPFAVCGNDWPDLIGRNHQMDGDTALELDETMNNTDQFLLENGLADDEAQEDSESEREHGPSQARSSPIMSLDGREQQEEKPIVRFRLSSRHLILASSYFQRMLTGPWKESNIEPGSDYTISARDWDVEALLILMNIIHSQARKVPRALDPELLAKVAAIVDYYQCNEVVEIFAERWLVRIPLPLEGESYRDTVLRLLISWVFSDSQAFTVLTAKLLRSARGPVDSLKLPIPEAILDDLERDREVICGGLLRLLHKIIGALADGILGCSYECSSMLLGVLTSHLINHSLFPSPQECLYAGVSFERLMTVIRTIREPEWCGNSPEEGSPYRASNLKCFIDGPHRCTVYELLEPADRMIPQPVGFSLESYKGEVVSGEEEEEEEEEDKKAGEGDDMHINASRL